MKKLNKNNIEELKNFKKEKERSGQEAMRILAILLAENGSDSEFIEGLTGYNKKYALELRRKYLKTGINGLRDRKGKQPRALLTKRQREETIKVITRLTPKDFGVDENYWTTAILGLFIKEQYGVQYKSRTPLVLIFKEARFTYHKPDKQYHSRSQKAIDQWLEKYRPIIKQALSDDKTVVLVEDEMMLSTQTTTQKIWLPKGQFPKIDVANKRQNRCIYGALNVKNGHEYASKKMGANSESTCDFLDEIGNLYKGYKIVLLWDNASHHKSVKIKEYLNTTKHNFNLINFPPYAPELNPQEHVWKIGRSAVTHNTFILI